MANTLQVIFNSLPSTGEYISFSGNTLTFGPGGSQVPIGGDINTTASNYKDKVNLISGYSAVINPGELNTVYITSTTAPNITGGYISAGSSFATLNLSIPFATTGEGDTRTIQIDTLDKALMFLSTDFMDLGGKNNQVAYRNSSYLNFASPGSSTPSYLNGAKVIICKNPVSVSGVSIKSYLLGDEGGITPNANASSTPGWEWWTKSFLIKDVNSGQCQTVFNSITDTSSSGLNQNNNTCAWLPGVNAISDSPSQPSIPGTCGLPTIIPQGSVTTVNYVYTNGFGVQDSINSTNPLYPVSKVVTFSQSNSSQTAGIGSSHTWTDLIITAPDWHAFSQFDIDEFNSDPVYNTYDISGTTLLPTQVQITAVGDTIVSPTGEIWGTSAGYKRLILTFTDPIFSPGDKDLSMGNAVPVTIGYPVQINATNVAKIRVEIFNAMGGAYTFPHTYYLTAPIINSPSSYSYVRLRNSTINSTFYIRTKIIKNGSAAVHSATTTSVSLYSGGFGSLSVTAPASSPDGTYYSANCSLLGSGGYKDVTFYSTAGSYFSGSYIGLAAFPNPTTTNPSDEIPIYFNIL